MKGRQVPHAPHLKTKFTSLRPEETSVDIFVTSCIHWIGLNLLASLCM